MLPLRPRVTLFVYLVVGETQRTSTFIGYEFSIPWQFSKCKGCVNLHPVKTSVRGWTAIIAGLEKDNLVLLHLQNEPSTLTSENLSWSCWNEDLLLWQFCWHDVGHDEQTQSLSHWGKTEQPTAVTPCGAFNEELCQARSLQRNWRESKRRCWNAASAFE